MNIFQFFRIYLVILYYCINAYIFIEYLVHKNPNSSDNMNGRKIINPSSSFSVCMVLKYDSNKMSLGFSMMFICFAFNFWLERNE